MSSLRSARTFPGERCLSPLAVVCGVALGLASLAYLIEPAASLPDFFPGRSDSSQHHVPGLGIACALLGYGLLGVAGVLPAHRSLDGR